MPRSDHCLQILLRLLVELNQSYHSQHKDYGGPVERTIRDPLAVQMVRSNENQQWNMTGLSVNEFI